jgi:HSP20 family protein
MYFVPLSLAANRRQALMGRALDRFFAAPWTDVAAATGADVPAAAGSATSGSTCASQPARTPMLDVAENERAFIATVDLPGVEKRDINVSVEGRKVRIEASAAPAETNAQAADGAPTDSHASNSRVLYRERAVAHYARSFSLPQEVDQAEARASFVNGVLTLTLPKRAQHVTQRVTVN